MRNKIVIPEIMRGYGGIKSGFTLSREDRKKFLSAIGYGEIIDKLPSREYDCLEQLSHGKTTKEIARFFQISPRTVETYINRMKDKFNCISKSQLAEIYWELNETKFS